MAEAKTLQKVYDKLRTDIICGTYRGKGDLPSIAELCEHFNAGRNTIRSALKMLEDEQLIQQEKGRNAKVIFDVNQAKYFQVYQETLYGRMPTMIKLLKAMEYIMPEIAEEALRNASEEDLKHLRVRIASLKEHAIDSGRSMMDALMNVYLYAFSLLDNDHVIHLFSEMMQFVTVLVPKKSMREKEMQKSVVFLGNVMSTIVDFVVRSDTAMVKKGVKLMAHSSSKKLVHYVERVVDPQIELHPIAFQWNYNKDYLYQEIIVTIINDIYLGTYEKGQALPSFEQLAKQFDVSVRTSRKAIERLNQYQIVKTINGIGSFVCDYEDVKEAISRNKEILQHVKDYCEVLQLLYLCVRGMSYHLMRQLSDQELDQILKEFQQISTPSLDPLLHTLFSKNECLLSIYEELKKDFIWCIYLKHACAYAPSVFQFDDNLTKLCKFIEKKQLKKASNQINAMLKLAYEKSWQAYLEMQS